MASASLSAIADARADVRDILNDTSVGHLEATSRIFDLGISTSEASVRRYRTKQGLTLAPSIPVARPGEQTVAEEAAPDADAAMEALTERVEELKTANNRLYKQYLSAKRRSDEMIEAVYKAARDAAEFVGHTPVIPPKRDTRGKSEQVALWHLTDWQGGKKTSTYNRSVMDERVEKFVDKAHKITDTMRQAHTVKHGVVLLTGDMVEGVSIFPGQVWELDGTLFEQMFHVADRIEWTVRQALSLYETVDVIAEWGNHGRLGKPSDGFKPSDNVDRMVYEVVRQRLANEDRLTSFQTSGSWYQRFEVGAYKAIGIHGDEIKGFGGNVPAYGILRKSNAWASGVIPGGFTDVYIGHYHQAMQLQLANGGNVFMTGSPESDNEYAREFVAATGKPSQRINFIDPEEGYVTYECKIWL